jgi:hypothetical protein
VALIPNSRLTETGFMTTNSDAVVILDSVMPDYDVTLVEQAMVSADPVTTWCSARELDLLTVRSRILDAAMWIRGLPAYLAGRSAPVPPRLLIADGGLPDWLVLGESGHEIVFGAVGRFWNPVITWRTVTRDDFARFDEPGCGKIAANFAVTPHGTGTLMSYECRTATTDPVARRRFRRDWWVVRPFVAHIMRATVRTIKDNAEQVAQDIRDNRPARNPGTKLPKC